MKNNLIWWIIGIIAVILIFNYFNKPIEKIFVNPAECSSSYSECIADTMIQKCGYQTGELELTQKECMMNDLREGDTVDDCWYLIDKSIDPSREITNNNLKIINCYLKIDYDDKKTME